MKFYEEEYSKADKAAFYASDPKPVLEECANCRRPSEDLVYLHGWDFSACPACARECQLTDEAERLCPVLYDQVIAAKGVREIEAVFKTHSASPCAACEGSRKGPARDSHPGRETQPKCVDGQVA